jgi:hypothetical protein
VVVAQAVMVMVEPADSVVVDKLEALDRAA